MGTWQTYFAGRRPLIAALIVGTMLVAGVPARAANRLDGITVERLGDGRLVRIRTASAPTFTVFRLSDPMRVVVDISGSETGSVESAIAVEDGVLGQIAVRQFSSGGFSIARVMVGFDKELPYEVHAEGNAVVVVSGQAIGAAIERMTPPPVAPVDRAAAERLEVARRDADAAAATAQKEREGAERAGADAKRQQLEAGRVAAQAERMASEARSAKDEAELLRASAAKSAAQDREQAELAVKRADERLRQAEGASRAVAQQRADAERAAAKARQAQSDAEQTAAEAEAKAKLEVAALEERRALAEKEQKAAEAARERAAAAKREAQAAQKAAERARADAEKMRNETNAQLAAIGEREKQLATAEKALSAERTRLERDKQGLAAREQQIEQERQRQAAALRATSERDKQALAERERQLAAERAKQANEQKALAERERQLAEKEQKADKERQAERQRETERDARAEQQRQAELQRHAEREKQLADKERQLEQVRLTDRQKQAERDKQLAEKERQLEQERKAALERQAAQSQRAEHEETTAAKVAAETSKTTLVASLGSLRGVADIPTVGEDTHLRCTAVQVDRAHTNTVVFSINGEPDYEMQRLDNPPRLVLDIANTARGTRRTFYALQADGVERVRLGEHGTTLRAVFDLADARVEPVITASDAGLRIVMRRDASAAGHEPSARRETATVDVKTRGTKTTTTTTTTTTTASTGNAARTPANASTPAARTTSRGPTPAAPQSATLANPAGETTTSASTTTSQSAADPAGDGAAVLRDVRFDKNGSAARIVIEVNAGVTALVDDRSPKTWVLQLQNARIPKALERSLDSTAYGTVVRMVSSYQASETPAVVNIVANLGGPATQKLKQQGNSLIWEIQVDSSRTPIAASATPQTAGFATEAAVLAASTPRQSSGKRVNMRLKDADLVNVIRFIADITGENIIVSEDVKGKVTLNLRNVPWEQALDTILRSRGYDKVKQHNIIRIATAEQIQKDRDRELVKKKAQFEVEDTIVRMISVNYAVAKELMDQLKPILSSRGTIQVDDRTNTVIAQDLRENVERIIELTRRLDRQIAQVLIEARIVEASSNYVQELGIQWGGIGQATTATGNPTGLRFPGDFIGSGSADDASTVANSGGNPSPSRYAVNLPAAIGTGAGGGIGFIFGSAGGSQLLNLRLSALESNGSGRIISSPRIATLDNRTAKIAQGVDIPISVVSAAGTNTRFIPANLELEVTPHVTNDGTVLLKIKVSKNEPDFANRGANGDPTIVKKNAETDVMVRDGDTSVIGGIFTRNTSENYSEVPLLAKIPILGWLFKKRRIEDRRAELLVFITPRIINRDEALVAESTLGPGSAPPGRGPAGQAPASGQPAAAPPDSSLESPGEGPPAGTSNGRGAAAPGSGG